MRFIISCIALFVLVAMATGQPVPSDPKPIYNVEDAPALFEKYIKDFNKTYKDEADKQVHFVEFVKSLKMINKLNSDPNNTATFGINQFTDQTAKERAQSRGLITNIDNN